MEVVKAAEAAFGKLKPKDLPLVAAQPYFLSAEMTFRNDEMGPLAYLSCGYEGVPLVSSDSVTFDLMAQLMGTYDSKAVTIVPPQISGNRLTYEVSNKMQVGCADYYTFFNKQFTDTGLFGWFAIADELAVEHCVGEMIFGVNGLSSYSALTSRYSSVLFSLRFTQIGDLTSVKKASALALFHHETAYTRGWSGSASLYRRTWRCSTGPAISRASLGSATESSEDIESQDSTS